MRVTDHMRKMIEAALKHPEGLIVTYSAHEGNLCNDLKMVGLAEHRPAGWYVTEKARKLLQPASKSSR